MLAKSCGLVLFACLNACNSLPEVAVASVGKALADARAAGEQNGAASVEVTLAIAYGVKGGITIPIAVPITVGSEFSSATTVKFVLDLNKRPAADSIRMSAHQKAAFADEEVYIYDPNTGSLRQSDPAAEASRKGSMNQ